MSDKGTELQIVKKFLSHFIFHVLRFILCIFKIEIWKLIMEESHEKIMLFLKRIEVVLTEI